MVLTPKIAAGAVVIADVVGAGEAVFRAAHNARGGFGCAARKDVAAGRIGSGDIRHQVVTGKPNERRIERRGALGSCLVGLLDR